MEQFELKSTQSDLRLVLNERKGDYFKAHITASHLNASREVYAYSDAYGFAELFEFLAKKKAPWKGGEEWSSLEGEFRISASCTLLGVINFTVELNNMGATEEWKTITELQSELGQLDSLAKSARRFFGGSPT